MVTNKLPAADPNRVLGIIMGGGQGTRLFPLTKERAKPAVPLAGKYRLVDIPISNCINSGLRRIYVLTQFNSASLHRHISQSYKFDHFSRGFVEILAARTNLHGHVVVPGHRRRGAEEPDPFPATTTFDYVLILSGDQLVPHGFPPLDRRSMPRPAPTSPSRRFPWRGAEAQSLGIMQIDAQRRIIRFEEKPKDPAVLDALRAAARWLCRDWASRAKRRAVPGVDGDLRVQPRRSGRRCWTIRCTDFGKHIIPRAIETHRVYSYVFQGYWEDIGTIRAFFEANLDLVTELPRFNFFDMAAPIFTPAPLPARVEDQRRLAGPRGHFGRLHSEPLQDLPQPCGTALPRGCGEPHHAHGRHGSRLLRISGVDRTEYY